MDRLSKEKRSYTMSRIKGKNTKPELIMFEELDSLGLKYERHYNLLGNPDIVFPKEKIAIFIDGEFWHGKDFKKRKGKLPEYWVKKLRRNMNRDRKYRSCLKREGWVVKRFWETRILKRTKSCTESIIRLLETNQKVERIVECS